MSLQEMHSLDETISVMMTENLKMLQLFKRFFGV